MRHVGVRLGINVLYHTFFSYIKLFWNTPPPPVKNLLFSRAEGTLTSFEENSTKILIFSPSLSPKLTDTAWQADGQDEVLSQAAALTKKFLVIHGLILLLKLWCYTGTSTFYV